MVENGNHHGITVTKAKWFVYLFSDDSFLVVEVDRLKKFIKINDKLTIKTAALYSNNPTKGYLLMKEDVSNLTSSRVYDTIKDAKSL